MVAAKYGEADCVEALLEWGADKDAVDNDGWTALHWAAVEAKLECVRLLVRVRADRAKKNKDGKTAHDLARQGAKAEVAALLEQAVAKVSSARPSASLACKSRGCFLTTNRAG